MWIPSIWITRRSSLDRSETIHSFVINPPARNKRSHWLNDDLKSDPQGWYDAAQEQPGSWWPDWDAWVKRHSSGTVPAPTRTGNEQYKLIEPAPGRYVKQKSN